MKLGRPAQAGCLSLIKKQSPEMIEAVKRYIQDIDTNAYKCAAVVGMTKTGFMYNVRKYLDWNPTYVDVCEDTRRRRKEKQYKRISDDDIVSYLCGELRRKDILQKYGCSEYCLETWTAKYREKNPSIQKRHWRLSPPDAFFDLIEEWEKGNLSLKEISRRLGTNDTQVGRWKNRWLEGVL